MLVARAYFLNRAQCAWARAGACASFSGDHGIMPPVSLPVTPEWTSINHASTALAVWAPGPQTLQPGWVLDVLVVARSRTAQYVDGERCLKWVNSRRTQFEHNKSAYALITDIRARIVDGSYVP